MKCKMPGDDDNTLEERDVDDGVVPYCSDGWHCSGKYYGHITFTNLTKLSMECSAGGQ